MIFIGVVVGMVVNLLFPFIPEGVCVLAAAAGFSALAGGMPISISLMFGGLTQPALLPAAALGALVAYTVRAAILPEQAAAAPGPTPPASAEPTLTPATSQLAPEHHRERQAAHRGQGDGR
jgi:hypothetical protein